MTYVDLHSFAKLQVASKQETTNDHSDGPRQQDEQEPSKAILRKMADLRALVDPDGI